MTYSGCYADGMITLLTKMNENLHKIMALPAFLLFAVFFLYPLMRGIGFSLTDWDGITTPKFIGLQNFIDFFSDSRAKDDIKNTLLFALGSAVLLNVLGFLYALVLDGKFRGRAVARAIVYLPAVISPLIMGYIWYFILQPERGFMFQVLKKIGAEHFMGNGLSDYRTAMWMMVLVNVWQFAGMTMTIYLAGLQSIPQEIYEVSVIDGAGYFQKMWYITIPLLIPSIQINVVTNIIGSLSVFDIIMALTEGGPGYSTESLSIYIMRMCYGSRTGYSTAVAIILFLLILVPVIISMKLMQSKEVEKL